MTRKTAPVLDVRDLSIHRGDTRILSKLTWRVEPGEHWVILGANGSGKTSLLSALAGYLMPTEGSFSVLGRCYGKHDWRELRKRIGLVSSSIRQMMADAESAIETVVSGRHAMIDFWGTITQADRRRASDILQQIEGTHLADRPWLHLSQGERQRVLIGRALMARPRLLILDEPCAGLDPAAREHFLEFIQRLGLQPNAPSLILVTHHVEEIMPVFTHVLILKDGRRLAAGPTQTMLTSAHLTRAFNSLIRLHHRTGRFHLTVRSKRRGVM